MHLSFAARYPKFATIENKKSLQLSLGASVARNLQSLNFFENDLGLAMAINDDTLATK